ncbi:UDP-glucose dehydrogenase family protein [Helicobacter cappadocius]|uniref:UDP-glucose 6-dehydrogenase n=1 Tax=Helicobacter cappadocius TaxID=3063998 RepID=A0AA90Q446_9HELI|nr:MULTISPECIES: UDP-glucose/GDP-mannose dehydrogenase family protein [unclassified Helicobacter]MDO7253864.1 UDP-glucose/GDP-mannose dehydrogenase family protein [Helicobacter sp. faydin-H75]MDP2539818.1 UDP-glucose/GDP-mannose dehydrogenase family protein [Helicobacter sp. faydin-H76]
MKITIVGSGYVGLVASACFAEMGNEVIVLDIDENKINQLKNGIIPIYEPGLEKLIEKNTRSSNLIFSTDKKTAYTNREIIFIAVGTPMGEDGSADITYVLNAARDIAEHINQHTIIVNKSTVPVGTTKKIQSVIKQYKKNGNINFDIISNPEFLKEGVAINDFMSPDRIIIGYENPKALEVMKMLYSPFLVKNNRIITMDLASSEMSKYASNAMLATKISFINEMSQICEKVGANINDVRIGIGSDSRIGYSFIYPGCGYGGSCFPKDIKALQKTAKEFNVSSFLIDAVDKVNQAQKLVLPRKIKKHFGENLQNRVFCIWGLSFKPKTDDIRESSAIVLISELLKLDAKINAYDPKAISNMKNIFQNISYYEDKYQALKDCDALIIVTEWKEFRNPDFNKISSLLKEKIIFDGRNIYKDHQLLGFKYYSIGGGGGYREYHLNLYNLHLSFPGAISESLYNPLHQNQRVA